MKLSITLFLTSIVSSSAFVATVGNSASAALRMSSDPNRNDDFGVATQEPAQQVNNDGVWGEPEPVNKQPITSQALPFMNAPLVLDGSMPGDVGFDPLGFAKTEGDLTTYREAEVKHARLAMLAAAGWPISELLDKKIASLFGLPGVLDEAGRVPSVLNGGMDKISPFYWGFCLLLAGAADFYGSNRASNVKGYTPGDLGFDPFGLYPKDDKGKKWMQAAEIKNGRIAMIAITAFAFQEFASHVPVVEEVPFLFKPFWATMGDTVADTVATPPVYESPPVFEPSTPLFDSTPSEAVDAVTSAVAPEVAVPAAEPVTTMSSSTMDAVSSASTATTEAATSVITPPAAEGSDELIAAKKRIAELEAKLAAVGITL